jgi:SAM-dependent methyltransferase
MSAANMPYIDDQIDTMGGDAPGSWRALHWGYYEEPDEADDDPDAFVQAAEALTELIRTSAGIADGSRVLDVGCGFGGTLDHIAERNPGTRLTGLNIDERQLRVARRLLETEARAADPATPLVLADGCALPVADGSLDHVTAVECIFHFPSRKTFMKEAARVLRPGGTLALSDFLFGPGARAKVLANLSVLTPDNGFYGSNRPPLTSAGYARLARSVGLDVVVDLDITRNTLPTYAALRRSYAAEGLYDAVEAVTGSEGLARAGGWEYHVIAFRKRDGD